VAGGPDDCTSVKGDQRFWKKGLLVGQKQALERARLVHWRCQESHDGGATLLSLSEPSTANSRSCVTLTMRSSGAAFLTYLYSLRVAALPPQASNRAGGRTSKSNLGGCPSHH
jgi:hypothetical protein